MNFYLFGLQRSGTSFFGETLCLNFESSYLNSSGTWKHSLTVPQTVKETVDPVFVIFKNPYTWIESICYRDPADLLVTSAKTYALQEANTGELVFGHDGVNLNRLAQLYEDYANKWLDLSSATVVLYEQIIDQSFRDNFLNSLNWIRKSNRWIVPEPGSLFMSEGFESERIAYYLKQQPSRLDKEKIDIINSIVSDTTFNQLGYNKIVGG